MKNKVKKVILVILSIVLLSTLPKVTIIADELNTEDNLEEHTNLDDSSESDVGDKTEEQPQLPESIEPLEPQLPSNELDEIDKFEEPVSEELDIAIPTSTDFIFNGSVISGLTSSYLESLSANQKQNIQLIIPKSILYNGVEKEVTSIANKAFYKDNYANYLFTYLDLSNATSLVSIGDYAFRNNSKMNGNIILPDGLKNIGEWSFASTTSLKGELIIPDTVETIKTHAFDGCSGLSGSLVIPNSVKEVGTYAFSNCSGMTGNLTLSNQLVNITDYSFAYSGFTGELIIPESVGRIGASAFRQSKRYNGFTGTLMIPSSVKSIGTVAFSYQGGITSVTFLDTSLTAIDTSVFRGTGLSGVLVLPDSIKSISTNSFAETNLETVYLNKVETITDSSFTSNSKLTAIVCSKENYSSFYEVLRNAEKTKLGYPVTINFDDGASGSYDSIERLYGLPYNVIKEEDGSWAKDGNYEFPAIQVAGKSKWGLKSDAVQGVKVTDKVSNEMLYAIEDIGNPTLVFSDGVDKVYDGLPSILSVEASHPKAKPIGEAVVGDVIFNYTWRWATIGGSSPVLTGWDKNIYSFSDVRYGEYAIIASVTVQACVLKEGGKAAVFDTYTHNFPVYLRQAESRVNAIYPKDTIPLTETMPEIKTSEGDTVGVISWDANQTLKEGRNEYKWTFNPPANSVGSTNYKSVKGVATLSATRNEIYPITIMAGDHGKITPNGTLNYGKNELVDLRIVPETSYKVASLKVDNVDVTSKIKDNKYSLNVQAAHKVEVTFELMDNKDVEDKLDNLPIIPEGEEVTSEQTEDILNAMLDFESLKDEDKLTISEKALENVCNALAKLPQIKMEVSEKTQIDGNANLLLENISADDIKALLSNPDAKLALNLEVAPVKVDESDKEIIDELLAGDKVENYFEIDVIKQLMDKDNITSDSKISELKSPIKLTFDVDDPDKEYYMIRMHKDSNGDLITSKLVDEDSNPKTCTISSDKFSLYALAYQEKKAPNPGESGGFIGSYYEVILNIDENNILTLDKIKKGSTIPKPQDPIKEGYIFKGWYTDSHFTNQWDFEKDEVKGRLMLYARWEKIEEEIVEPVLPEEIIPNEEVEVPVSQDKEVVNKELNDGIIDPQENEELESMDIDEEKKEDETPTLLPEIKPEPVQPSTNNHLMIWIICSGLIVFIVGVRLHFLKRK